MCDDKLDFTGIQSNADRFNHYFISGTNVLKNLLNLSNHRDLVVAEKYLVALSYAKAKLVKQSFNFVHLQAIHKALFGEIYSFAGELRQANMGKTIIGDASYDQPQSMFMDYQEIPYHIQFFDSYMRSKNNLAGISDREKFAWELCEVYLFINDIHAFREGNGRTQNEFVRQLAQRNGYLFDIQQALADYRDQGINYYRWFDEYSRTGKSDLILNNLFLKQLKRKDAKVTKRI